MKRKKFPFMLLSAAAFAVASPFAVDQVHAEEAVVVEEITANLFIGDAGEMVDYFEIQVDDIAKIDGVNAGDFDITGNYDGYPLNEKGELVQPDYEEDGIELSIEGDTLILDVEDFKYPGGPLSEFQVINDALPALSFTKANVTDVNTKTVDEFAAATFTGENGVTIPYRLYSADTGKPEPLVIYMHGSGEVGTDNVKPITTSRGAVAFAESGYTTNVIAAQYPYSYSRELTDAELEDMKAFFSAYKELIQQLVEEGKVDPRRIYITGASMGGGLTLQFILNEPDLFAAAVPVASRGTVEDLSDLEAIADLPIWLFHANDDPVNTSAASKDIYHKLQDLNNKDAKLTIYSTEYMNSLKMYSFLLHWSWVPAYNDADMMEWMFKQKNANNKNQKPEIIPGHVNHLEKGKEMPAQSNAAFLKAE